MWYGEATVLAYYMALLIVWYLFSNLTILFHHCESRCTVLNPVSQLWKRMYADGFSVGNPVLGMKLAYAVKLGFFCETEFTNNRSLVTIIIS